jgi:hypothetical protein
MAATTTITRYTGAATSQVGTAVSTGTKIQFSNDDSNTGTTAIHIPTSTGTAYSQEVVLGLGITTAATPTSTISNRQLALATAMNSGTYLFPKTATDSTYVQGAVAPANGGTAGAVPTGYNAAMTTTPFTYDATSVSGTATSNTAPATANGAFQRVIFGVDQTVTTTGTVALPNISLSYTEQ